MEKTGWKIIAIVSIILLICALASIALIFKAGTNYEAKRTACAYDICELGQGEHDSYFYSDVDDSCFCFSKGELDFIDTVH